MSPASFQTRKLCGQHEDTGVRSSLSVCLRHMTSEHASTQHQNSGHGTRIPLCPLGVGGVCQKPAQQNHSLSVALMLRCCRSAETSPRAGTGRHAQRWPQGQPSRLQEPHPGPLRVCEPEPHSSTKKRCLRLPWSGELRRRLTQNLLGYGRECRKGRALRELQHEVSALLQAPCELRVQGHRACEERRGPR